MRDPDRIDRIIDKLREVWKANPDLRLGQLLVNAIRPSQPCPQIFYPEDDVIQKGLLAYQSGKSTRYTANEVTLELSKAEALTLIAFLIRFRDRKQLEIEHTAEAQILWDVCALLEHHLGRELLDATWPHILDNARKHVQDEDS